MSSAPTWTRHQLKSALWAAHVLGTDGAQKDGVRASWAHLPIGGAIGFDDLESALAGLTQIGLITQVGQLLVPDQRLAELASTPTEQMEELLFELLLHQSPPLWTRTAVQGAELAHELIPDEAMAAFESAIPDPARREAVLLAIGQRFDDLDRRAIGSIGEEEVVSRCKAELVELGASDVAQRVRRVSLISDLLGYDVTAPRLDGSIRRLEVKATRSSGPEVTVFVSRNEATVGARDPDWALVVVGVTPQLEVDGVLGWLAGTQLTDMLPRDGTSGTWQVAKLRLIHAALDRGIPSAGEEPS